HAANRGADDRRDDYRSAPVDVRDPCGVPAHAYAARSSPKLFFQPCSTERRSKMKAVGIAAVCVGLSTSVLAQPSGMTGMGMKGEKGTEMKGDMKDMDVKDMSPSGMSKEAKPGTHHAKGTVKSVDAKAGTVTLDHEPVK